MATDVNLTASVPGIDELPREFQPRTLRRRALQALIALAVLFAIVLFAPGLGEVRTVWPMPPPAGSPWRRFEGLSFASYVVMFGPIFCTGLGWRGAGRSVAPSWPWAPSSPRAAPAAWPSGRGSCTAAAWKATASPAGRSPFS